MNPEKFLTYLETGTPSNGWEHTKVQGLERMNAKLGPHNLQKNFRPIMDAENRGE